MLDEINIEAFKFVAKLTTKFPVNNSFQQTPGPELKGIEPIIDLGEVSDFGIAEFDEDTYLTKRKSKDINGKLIGLDTSEYSEFKDFILNLFTNAPKSFNCDFVTLLDAAFEWLLEVYEHQQAQKNLITFLLDKIDSLTDEYHFYFQIKALAIETPFSIGDIEIRFFEESEISELYKKLEEDKSERTFEEFKKIYSKHFNSIHAFIKVKGVLNRANEIAFRETELAIDVLKCFCCSYSTEKLIQMFDVDYRFHQGSNAQYMCIPNGNIKEATIQNKNLSGMVPVQLTTDFIGKAEKVGLKIFSQFIQNKKETELYYITIDLIKQLSAIVSTHNNYEKAVKSISLFESICVPRDSAKAKGETYLKKKVIPKLFSTHDTEVLSNLIRIHYEIRDKYLHNYIELPLNKNTLATFLEYQRFFVLKIIELNTQFVSLSDILTYFEIT